MGISHDSMRAPLPATLVIFQYWRRDTTRCRTAHSGGGGVGSEGRRLNKVLSPFCSWCMMLTVSEYLFCSAGLQVLAGRFSFCSPFWHPDMMTFYEPKVINHFLCDKDSCLALSCPALSCPDTQCSVYLTCIAVWYSSTMFLYIRQSVQNFPDLCKFVNTFNVILTLLLKPFINKLRNKKVKQNLWEN